MNSSNKDIAPDTTAPPIVTASIEGVERDAWLDMLAAAAPDYAAAHGLAQARQGSIGLLGCPGLPISEFNRAMGLGAAASLDATALDNALAWLRQHGAPEAVFQLPPVAQTVATKAWLKRRGFERRGNGWAKFVRGAEPLAAASGSVDASVKVEPEVRRVSTDNAWQFGQVVQGGFGLPEHCAPWFAALAGRPGWQLYLAYDGDVPMASGAMYLSRGWGWMGIDATLPNYRGRGAQTALIARRVADGLAAGVRGLTAETGQPDAGKEAAHTSYSNYCRGGFDVIYVRDNYR